jgi:hypothetical protein
MKLHMHVRLGSLDGHPRPNGQELWTPTLLRPTTLGHGSGLRRVLHEGIPRSRIVGN